jgi:hypothetical protein
MGIREAINENSKITVPIIGVLVAALLLWMIFGRSGSTPGVPSKAFFSVDDGKTWFRDDIGKVAPFQHDGKEAVRATVIQCSDGKQFVALLEKMRPEAKAELERLQSSGEIVDTPTFQRLTESGTLVKLPGQGDWMTRDEYQAKQVRPPSCPDGSDRLVVP